MKAGFKRAHHAHNHDHDGTKHVPLKPAGPSGVAQWTCPMHPEILRNAAGDCPIRSVTPGRSLMR